MNATIIALVPTLAFIGLLLGSLAHFGAVIEPFTPRSLTITPYRIVEATIISPFLETLVLAGVCRVLLLASSRPSFVAFASAMIFGALHGAFGFLWFFGVVWAFFVYSASYLAWRRYSFRRAILASAATHAVTNAIVLTIIVLVGAT